MGNLSPELFFMCPSYFLCANGSNMIVSLWNECRVDYKKWEIYKIFGEQIFMDNKEDTLCNLIKFLNPSRPFPISQGTILLLQKNIHKRTRKVSLLSASPHASQWRIYAKSVN